MLNAGSGIHRLQEPIDNVMENQSFKRHGLKSQRRDYNNTGHLLPLLLLQSMQTVGYAYTDAATRCTVYAKDKSTVKKMKQNNGVSNLPLLLGPKQCRHCQRLPMSYWQNKPPKEACVTCVPCFPTSPKTPLYIDDWDKRYSNLTYVVEPDKYIPNQYKTAPYKVEPQVQCSPERYRIKPCVHVNKLAASPIKFCYVPSLAINYHKRDRLIRLSHQKYGTVTGVNNSLPIHLNKPVVRNPVAVTSTSKLQESFSKMVQTTHKIDESIWSQYSTCPTRSLSTVECQTEWLVATCLLEETQLGTILKHIKNYYQFVLRQVLQIFCGTSENNSAIPRAKLGQQTIRMNNYKGMQQVSPVCRVYNICPRISCY